MNDPTHTPPHDPRRLTGVPEIDGTTTTQIIVDGHELTVDQAKAPEPFKLATQVGTVDLVLLDNEGEPHKIGEAEVVQGRSWPRHKNPRPSSTPTRPRTRRPRARRRCGCG